MTSQRAVQVIHLGRMGFLQAWDIQQRYASQHLQQMSGVRQAASHDVLLIVEHDPVYTAGLQSTRVGQEENNLKKLGAEFYRTNRQGLMMFHGPGQLVAYPILNLRRFQPCLKRYTRSLQSTLVDTCRRMGVHDCTVQEPGAGDVWVKGKLIGTVGVHSHQLITTHGLSLNCDVDLSWFHPIRPRGGQGVTSLSQHLHTSVPIRKVLRPFITAFGEEFQCEMELSMLDAEDASLLKEEGGMEGGDSVGVKSPFSAVESAWLPFPSPRRRA